VQLDALPCLFWQLADFAQHPFGERRAALSAGGSGDQSRDRSGSPRGEVEREADYAEIREQLADARKKDAMGARRLERLRGMSPLAPAGSTSTKPATSCGYRAA
jgi:hypothetical protein